MLLMLAFATNSNAQTTMRPQPKWWFGQSVAANWNFYEGTTQKLNDKLTIPTAFHKGQSLKPYASLLMEYRPNKVLGGMLNVAYDNRGGDFDEVMAPCNCPATLKTSLSYITIEPSLRIAPFANAFYVFAGPTIGFNLNKEFTYTQEKQVDKTADWSDVRETIFGAQAGAGIDIPISAKTNPMQMTLSPFASFQTNLFDQPRTIETWSVYTVRAGMALKFGKTKQPALVALPQKTDTVYRTITENDVQFSVRAPKVGTSDPRAKETFPLRNSVFFDEGSAKIPARYIQLNTAQSGVFKEEQLQQTQPENLDSGRSARQMRVYHNILNIIGDRMRANPGSSIVLTGSSDNNPEEGKLMAENVKQYLVTNYGIYGNRISTEGRDKPVIPSEQPGATKELVLLRAGDRRVDITSSSPAMLFQVGGTTTDYLKPVQITPAQPDSLDSHVIFTNTGASTRLKSWKVDIKDEKGNIQHYGPYTTDQASISGKNILGNNTQGNYTIVMTGETPDGKIIKKESSVSLMKMEDTIPEGMRYSVLFDFDKSKTIASYEKFLTETVAPLIPENGTVIIHGHTDIIGDENYNHTLSHERAMETQKILERALAKAGKKAVNFKTAGFGEEPNHSPFENNTPEERFYNRTVIIDIVPNK